MRKSVVIDCLPQSARRYRSHWAVVAVDVIRATTTAVTAAADGWQCYVAPDVPVACSIARKLDNPCMAGESGGLIPYDFEMNNSPAALALRSDKHRPMVLVSSSGTRLIHLAAGCDNVYLGCFRNYSALVNHLAEHHSQVAVIGAGSKDEFREEDQICCAWIAAGLMSRGYVPENQTTVEIAQRWQNAPPNACLVSHSVDFLMRTGQLNDLDFILSHVDDLDSVFEVRDGLVNMTPSAARATASIDGRLRTFPAATALEA